MNAPTSEHARTGPSRQRWFAIAVGGSFLTLLGSGIGSQLVMSTAVPSAAAPYAAAMIGIAALSLVLSTLIVGGLAGVRTRAQWLGALVAVTLPVLGAIALVALGVHAD